MYKMVNFKKKNTWIFFIVYLAYMSIYVARVNLSIAGSDMRELGILDEAQLGILGSCFSIVFAVGRMANGTLSDMAPPWLMLTIGLVLAGISNLLVSFFPPFIAIAIFWIINAYAQSMLWSSVLCTVSAIYDKSVVKKKASLMVTSVATGNIASILINTYVITHFDVKYAFIVPGVTTIALGILTLLATRNIKNEQKTAKNHTSIRQLLKSKELLIMNTVAMLHGVMKENISLWMAVYIVDTYFVDLSQSSFYILLIPVIGFVGRILFPFLYRVFKENENRVALIGFAFCILAAVVLCMGKVGMLISAIAMGGIYMAVSVINTSIVSIYPLSYQKTGNTASVSGIMDFATYLGGGISSAIYGVVIKHCGYFPMFVSWAVISIVSVLILARLKNKKDF